MNNQVSEESKVQNLVEVLKKGVLVLAVALVLGLAWIGYQNYQESKAEQSFGELFKAEKLEELAERESAALKKTAIEVMKSWSQDKKDEYVSKLSTVLEKYPQSAAAGLAGLKLGRWFVENQDYSKAESHYLKLLEIFKSSNDSDKYLFRALMSEGLGLVYEESQKWSEAETLYKEMSDAAQNPLRPVSMLGLARAQRKLGKADEAKATYEKVYTDFPNSIYEKKARALRALL